MCGVQSHKLQNLGLKTEMARMAAPIRSLCFSPSNSILAVGSDLDVLSLVDVNVNDSEMRKKVCSRKFEDNSNHWQVRLLL